MPSRRWVRHRQCASRPRRRGRRCTCRHGARVAGRPPEARRPSARLRRCRCPQRGGGRPGGLQRGRVTQGGEASGPVEEGQGQSRCGVSCAPPRGGNRRTTAVGGGRDGNMCRLPNGSRTGPVTSAVIADSRDQPHQRARGTHVGTGTPPHGRPTRIARNARAGPVPSACVAAQPPKPLTKHWSRPPIALYL